MRETLDLLSVDPFQPRLRTHQLKGELKDSYACSVGYDLRIVFKFVGSSRLCVIIFAYRIVKYLLGKTFRSILLKKLSV
ncbi:MAG: hypothetical protein O9290_14285 [Microcystis sp. LE19-41.2A]|nr:MULTISPECIES: hypothetical protein [unclassified Microcystis]MCZ8047772.1 hypothetical protein [Microcystis sp. LE19-41.2A]MCZ8289573.1 hypothetical protein [Microcystis sp. LE19-59.1C]